LVIFANDKAKITKDYKCSFTPNSHYFEKHDSILDQNNSTDEVKYKFPNLNLIELKALFKNTPLNMKHLLASKGNNADNNLKISVGDESKNTCPLQNELIKFEQIFSFLI
jgi:hypothetical protein